MRLDGSRKPKYLSINSNNSNFVKNQSKKIIMLSYYNNILLYKSLCNVDQGTLDNSKHPVFIKEIYF